MKNIFTRALALTIVFALCAVSAFAAPAFTTDGVVYDLEAGTIDVATNGYTAGKSATLLVVKDGANLASLAANDIIYIDQEDNLAATTQAWTDIPLADRIAALNAAKAEGAADITAVNVYIGGTEVTAAIPYKGDGDTVAAIAVAEEEPTPEPNIETAYAVTVAAGEYTSLDAVKAAALTVTKTVTINDVAEAPVTLAASEYTVAYEDADGTVTITVTIIDDGKTATTTATYTAPVEPPVSGGKTAIAGTVKFNNVAIANALVLVTKSGSAAVVGTALTDSTGAYEVEVTDAGNYRVIVRAAMLTPTGGVFFNNYTGTATVVADQTTTFNVVPAMVKTGDTNGDGVVNFSDYKAVTDNYQG